MTARCLFVSCWLALLAGCGSQTGGAGDRPEGFRLVTGAVAVPDGLLGRQVTGLQMVGIAIGDGFDVFPSSVFDGARVEDARFTAAVSGEHDFVLVLQLPSASNSGPGTFVAALRFANGAVDGTLVPRGTDDIALGTLTIEVGDAPGANRLVAAEGNNPLAQIDTDGDGTTDLLDDDDDDDGEPDLTDTDVGGDGVEDVKQTLSALPDADGDGVPDALGG